MEPLAMATVFATIVGLISNYKSSSDSRSQDEFNHFLEWLIKNNHLEIKKIINDNIQLSDKIKESLEESSFDLQEKISKLNEAIGIIAGKIDCFSGIAEAIDYKKTISTQAISVLEQHVNSGAPFFVEIDNTRDNGGNTYILMGGHQKGEIQYNEEQFIEDDLRVLVERGFLRLEFGKRGNKIFYITRAAQYLIQ